MTQAPATPPKSLASIASEPAIGEQPSTPAAASSKHRSDAGDNREQVIVDDQHPFAIESELTRFNNRTGITRLLHIANHSKQLAPQACAGALELLKRHTLDHELYSNVARKSGIQADAAWIEMAAEQAQELQVKLEVELRGYQSNLIKESIRLTQMALGHHAIRTGAVPSAITLFASSREYISTPQHQIDISLAIIEATLSFKHNVPLEPHIAKLEAAIDRLPAPPARDKATAAAEMSLSAAEVRERTATDRKNARQRENFLEKVRIAKALTALSQGEFERAARGFAGVIEHGGLGDWNGKIIDKADLALFAALTALASLPRTALKSLLTENPSFRALADDADRFVSDMLEAFLTAHYKTVIDLLERYAPTIELNPYLTSHAARLVSAIRTRACVQYFAPYQTVQIRQMAEAFGTDEESMLAEVVALVQDGRLDARIDLIDRVLELNQPDPRGDVFAKAIQVGHDANVATARAYLRMLLVEAKITVERPGNSASAPAEQDDEAMDVAKSAAPAGAAEELIKAKAAEATPMAA